MLGILFKKVQTLTLGGGMFERYCKIRELSCSGSVGRFPDRGMLVHKRWNFGNSLFLEYGMLGILYKKVQTLTLGGGMFERYCKIRELSCSGSVGRFPDRGMLVHKRWNFGNSLFLEYGMLGILYKKVQTLTLGGGMFERYCKIRELSSSGSVGPFSDGAILETWFPC